MTLPEAIGSDPDNGSEPTNYDATDRVVGRKTPPICVWFHKKND